MLAQYCPRSRSLALPPLVQPLRALWCHWRQLRRSARSDLALLGLSPVTSSTSHGENLLTWTHIGSIAAGIQAGIGNVAAGSLFATAQSVAMGGALSGVITAVSTALGGICAAAGRSSESNRFSSCAFPAIRAVIISPKVVDMHSGGDRRSNRDKTVTGQLS
ncbi:hypothetical protein EDB89DRAFT_1953217 [Lactarius sanguifluus]|nr:hypothetical protein EDB89DRAFT_1953217 [Lactarius sanguifluus]